MSLIIDNEPRAYDWGELGGIQKLRGIASRAFHSAAASDGVFPVTDADAPEAELWLGTHPTWPSIVTDGQYTGQPLPKALTAEGRPADVGFLLKLLTIEQPLSVQVHPDGVQAASGFAREEAAGIALDSPQRNYRDTNAKPEMIFVVSETLELCAGFRPLDDTLIDLHRAVRATDGAEQALWQRFAKRVEKASDYSDALQWLLADEATAARQLATAMSAHAEASQPIFGVERDDLVKRLHQHHPDDIGLPLSLLLQHELLRRGQAVYLEPRTPHFYIRGAGIELMGPSDNVLRLGLTRKHIDVQEALSVLDTTPRAPRHLFEYHKGPTTVFHAAGAGLRLSLTTAEGEKPLDVPFHQGDIAYVLAGQLLITALDGGTQHVKTGQAALLIDAARLQFSAPSGHGTLIVAGATERA